MGNNNLFTSCSTSWRAAITHIANISMIWQTRIGTDKLPILLAHFFYSPFIKLCYGRGAVSIINQKKLSSSAVKTRLDPCVKFTRSDLGIAKFSFVLMEEAWIKQSSIDPFKTTGVKIYTRSFDGCCLEILKDDPCHRLAITSLHDRKSCLWNFNLHSKNCPFHTCTGHLRNLWIYLHPTCRWKNKILSAHRYFRP